MLKIRVHNLNALRLAYPKQSFTSNILRPKSDEEMEEVKGTLENLNIPYSLGNYDLGQVWQDIDPIFFNH